MFYWFLFSRNLNSENEKKMKTSICYFQNFIKKGENNLKNIQNKENKK